MRMITRVVGTALAGAALALAGASVAAAEPSPSDPKGADQDRLGVSCEGPKEAWTRGVWTFYLYEGDSPEVGDKVVMRKLKGVSCEVSALTWPRSSSEYVPR